MPCVKNLYNLIVFRATISLFIHKSDLVSRLPVRRKERIKVTASVLTSGSRKVALK